MTIKMTCACYLGKYQPMNILITELKLMLFRDKAGYLTRNFLSLMIVHGNETFNEKLNELQKKWRINRYIDNLKEMET